MKVKTIEKIKKKSMRKSILIVCLLLGTASLAAAQPVQIRVETPRPVPRPHMSTRVTITDGEGEPYVGLREDNIRLTLDGRPVDPGDMYTAFSDSARLGVVFVVDRSGSIGSTSLDGVRSAIQYLSATFAPYDQVGLLTFDSDVRVPVPIGRMTEEFEQRLRVIREGSDTALYDAVQRGAEMLNNAAADRRALIVFSDGRDTRSALTEGDVAQTLRTAGWPVYTVGTGKKVNEASLRQFASITDGRYVSTVEKSSISKIHSQLVRPLSGLHYVVQFPFGGNSLQAMHEVQVEVRYGGKPYRAATLFSSELTPSQRSE